MRPALALAQPRPGPWPTLKKPTTTMSWALMKAAAVSVSCSSVVLGPARRCIQRTMPSASMRPAAGLPPSPQTPTRRHQAANPLPRPPPPPRGCWLSPPSPSIAATPSPSPCCHPFTTTRPSRCPPAVDAVAFMRCHGPTAVGEGMSAVAITEELERGVGVDAKLIAQGCLRRGVHLAQPHRLRPVPQPGGCLGKLGGQPLAVPTPRCICVEAQCHPQRAQRVWGCPWSPGWGSVGGQGHVTHEPGTLQHTPTLFCVPAPYPMPLPCGPASHHVPLHQTLCPRVVTLHPVPLPLLPIPIALLSRCPCPTPLPPALHSWLCPVPLPVPSPCPHPGHLQNSTSSRLNSLKARSKLCS